MIAIDLPTQITMLTRVVRALEARIAALERHPKMIQAALPQRTPSTLRVRENLLRLLDEASALFGVSQTVIMSTRRNFVASHPRQWVMYESYCLGFSNAEIGRFLRRDHTTVMHGVKREAQRRCDVNALTINEACKPLTEWRGDRK